MNYTLPRWVQLMYDKNMVDMVEAYTSNKPTDSRPLKAGVRHLKDCTQLSVYVGTYNNTVMDVFFVCLSADPIPVEQWDQLSRDEFGVIDGDLGRHDNATAWEIANDYMMMESTR